MSAVFDAFAVAYGAAAGADVEAPLTPDELRGVIERAAAQKPVVVADAAAFSVALAEALAGGMSPGDVDSAELWLAVGCASGDTTATAEVERRFLEPLQPHLRQLGLDAGAQADVLQTTRRRLLMAEPGHTPRIVGYAGRGQLRALVRVVATRAALDAKRAGRRKREVALSGLTEVLMASSDPELAAAAVHKEGIFRAAFEGAVAGLDAADRTILRLYVLDGVGIDGVASAYGVHRSTAARRLAKVRETIRLRTRAELQKKGVSATELRSILAVVDQGLELTMSRILAESFEATPASGRDPDA